MPLFIYYLPGNRTDENFKNFQKKIFEDVNKWLGIVPTQYTIEEIIKEISDVIRNIQLICKRDNPQLHWSFEQKGIVFRSKEGAEPILQALSNLRSRCVYLMQRDKDISHLLPLLFDDFRLNLNPDNCIIFYTPDNSKKLAFNSVKKITNTNSTHVLIQSKNYTLLQ